jgi:hypothetical protein
MSTPAALPMPARQPDADMRLAELLMGSRMAMALHIVAQRRSLTNWKMGQSHRRRCRPRRVRP